MKRQLTAAEKAKVTRLATTGTNAGDIAGIVNLTDDEAYCSDDFCIAYAAGWNPKKARNRIRRQYPLTS